MGLDSTRASHCLSATWPAGGNFSHYAKYQLSTPKISPRVSTPSRTSLPTIRASVWAVSQAWPVSLICTEGAVLRTSCPFLATSSSLTTHTARNALETLRTACGPQWFCLLTSQAQNSVCKASPAVGAPRTPPPGLRSVGMPLGGADASPPAPREPPGARERLSGGAGDLLRPQ